MRESYVAPLDSRVVRILLATPYPHDEVAGVASFVRTLETELPARSVSVTVVAPPRGGAGHVGANVALAIQSANFLFRNRRSFDAVHGQQLHLQTVALALVARVLGIGAVVTVHGRSPVPTGLRGILLRLTEYFAVRFPHKTVFVAESLRAAFGNRGEVIPVGVPTKELRGIHQERDRIRRELGVAHAVVVCFVGRVTVDKGIWTLVESFRIARDHASVPLKLVVVGPLDSVSDEIHHRVRDFAQDTLIVGPQANPWRYLASADLFVLPSLHEGLPLSLLEAMAMGVAPIASGVGDIPRVIADGETGWLVRAGDVDSLAAAILRACGSPDLRAKVGRRAAESISATYEAATMLERYVMLYRQLPGQSGAGG